MVTDAAGTLLADCSIGWKPVTPGLPSPEFSVRTGGDGRFEVGLSSGVWTLEVVWCPGGEKGRAESVTIPDQGAVLVKIVAAAPAKAKAAVTAKLNGRVLSVAVKVKGAEPPRGKDLASVKVGKKVYKARLNSAGKAKVKLPKGIKKHATIKVAFLGTSLAKKASVTIRA